MPTFIARDGTQLAYRLYGAGSPVVCLAGGPMWDSAYLGQLGGLSAHVQLVVLDLRGTGQSARPDEVSSYRCDRQIDDVDDLRVHLGLERIDLLAHSAGANLAVMYAAAHTELVARLALITPSVRAVDIQITAQQRLDVARTRVGELWYPAAIAALEAITAGTGQDWSAITPFSYGRWDAAAQAHEAIEWGTNADAAAAFGGDDVFTPDVTRVALGQLQTPVLLVAGEVDVSAPPTIVAEYGGLFADAHVVVQPGAGHQPWLDDADRFVDIVAPFFG